MNAKKAKADMIVYLKEQRITEISSLWGYAKTYVKEKYESETLAYDAMGGSYASSGNFISVTLVKGKQRCKFHISLKEVQ